jgi:glycosyltransferase involved in cell wall biosynthesis
VNLEKGSGGTARPRVLVVVRWPVGGIRTWCRYVYRDSRFSYFDIELLMPQDPEAVVLQQDMAGTGIRTTLLDTGVSSRAFSLAAVRYMLRNRWDLIHSHGFTSGLASAVPAAAKRIPHLVTVHDVILDGQYRDWRGRVVRGLISRMLHNATRIHAVSEAAAKNLRHAFPWLRRRPDQLRVIRNGIDTERFASAQPEDGLRERLSIPQDAIVVGFFGRFMAQKGFRYLVDAVAAHRNANEKRPLVVLAVGGGGFRREEEHAVRARGLEENFRFIDFFPNIASLIRSVDVVAMPSLWEACGLVAMEALVAGTPLVVSDCDGLLEVAQDTPATVVPMRSAAALREAIALMADPARLTVAEHFREIAAERFDVRRAAAEVSLLYGGLLRP